LRQNLLPLLVIHVENDYCKEKYYTLLREFSMGKKKSARVNKTQAVREFFASQPNAMPKAVSEALKEKGVNVTPQIVSQIKYQLRLLGGRASGRKNKAAGDLTAADLVKVKELADRLGGQQKVAQALEILRRLG
jgi:hypothetical protein